METPENGAKESERLAETSLLDKYDFFVATKESENANLHRIKELNKLAEASKS